MVFCKQNWDTLETTSEKEGNEIKTEDRHCPYPIAKHSSQILTNISRSLNGKQTSDSPLEDILYTWVASRIKSWMMICSSLERHSRSLLIRVTVNASQFMDSSRLGQYTNSSSAWRQLNQTENTGIYFFKQAEFTRSKLHLNRQDLKLILCKILLLGKKKKKKKHTASILCSLSQQTLTFIWFHGEMLISQHWYNPYLNG